MDRAPDLGDEVSMLQAACEGDPAAVRWLVHDLGPPVFGYLYPRVGGDEPAAADLLQEVLLEAVRSGRGFRGESKALTWLCGIARHRLARHWEEERRDEIARAGMTIVEPQAMNHEASVDRRDELVRALGRIPASQRHVMILKYLDDRSVRQIAAELDRPEAQVQSLLQRGRDSLRRELGAA